MMPSDCIQGSGLVAWLDVDRGIDLTSPDQPTDHLQVLVMMAFSSYFRPIFGLFSAYFRPIFEL